MRSIFFGAFALTALGLAAVFGSGAIFDRGLLFERQERNPVTHLRVNQHDDEFQFAIVSDRTGGHRANIFSQAVAKLELLRPEFVISVGDLIEGGKRTRPMLEAEWSEFDGFVKKLSMPFFYVPGNHDVNTPTTTQLWQEKLGRTYYHFVYKNVLFLMLNTDDSPGKIEASTIGPDQIAYARQALADNRQVRWTIVALHRPLWVVADADKNGWGEIEKALAGREYTVFCGHVHRFQKFVRQGMNYYQLATTGGGSMLRGPSEGEFDQIAWVTMKKTGPVIANLLIDAILSEDLKKPVTNEPVTTTRLPTHPVRGRVYFGGVPAVGAQVRLIPSDAKGKQKAALGVVGPDGSFQVSTYTAYDGAAEGEYGVMVIRKAPETLPVKYSKVETSGLKATITSGPNDLLLELK